MGIWVMFCIFGGMWIVAAFLVAAMYSAFLGGLHIPKPTPINGRAK